MPSYIIFSLSVSILLTQLCMRAYNIIQNMTLQSLFEIQWIDCFQPFAWKRTRKMIYAAYTKPMMHVVSNITRNKYLGKLEGVQDDHKKTSWNPATCMTVRALIKDWLHINLITQNITFMYLNFYTRQSKSSDCPFNLTLSACLTSRKY